MELLSTRLHPSRSLRREVIPSLDRSAASRENTLEFDPYVEYPFDRDEDEHPIPVMVESSELKSEGDVVVGTPDMALPFRSVTAGKLEFNALSKPDCDPVREYDSEDVELRKAASELV